MSQAILVTGGAGYVGSHGCKALAAAGYRPVVYDSLSRGHRSAVKWGPLIEGDLRERDRLADGNACAPRDGGHAFRRVAYVGESVTGPELYYRNNVAGTLRCSTRCARPGSRRSSSRRPARFMASPQTVPIRETTPRRRSTRMARPSWRSSGHCIGTASAYGLRYAALRYFNAAGADPDGEIGEDHDPETHLIPLVLRAAFGNGEPLRIFGTDYPTRDGTAIRDYIHVTDLADAHARALRYLVEGGESIELNLGTGSGHSVREVVAAVERVTGRSVPRSEAPRRPGDPPELVADATLARQRLGWCPRYSDLDMIVRTALAWETRSASTGCS